MAIIQKTLDEIKAYIQTNPAYLGQSYLTSFFFL